MLPPFEPFKKIPRYNREMLITEKIDGTNAVIYIPPPDEVIVREGVQLKILAGSRSRWLFPGPNTPDNFGFGHWVYENQEALLRLGYGRHYGEWYGAGIQRRYGLTEKRLALFNRGRFEKGLPEGLPRNVELVPLIHRGPHDQVTIGQALASLRADGSRAVPGFMAPEGVVIFLPASSTLYKITLENDESPKGKETPDA